MARRKWWQVGTVTPISDQVEQARRRDYDASGAMGSRMEQKRLKEIERKAREAQQNKKASSRGRRGRERMQQRRLSAYQRANMTLKEVQDMMDQPMED